MKKKLCFVLLFFLRVSFLSKYEEYEEDAKKFIVENDSKEFSENVKESIQRGSSRNPFYVALEYLKKAFGQLNDHENVIFSSKKDVLPLEKKQNELIYLKNKVNELDEKCLDENEKMNIDKLEKNIYNIKKKIIEEKEIKLKKKINKLKKEYNEANEERIKNEEMIKIAKEEKFILEMKIKNSNLKLIKKERDDCLSSIFNFYKTDKDCEESYQKKIREIEERFPEKD